MRPFDQLSRRGKIGRLRVIAENSLLNYDLSIKQLRFLVQETNTMFRVDSQDGERYALRIYSDGESTLRENQAEMFWLDALMKDTDLSITQPVRNKLGEYITVACAEGVPDARRTALFRWVQGGTLYNQLTPRNYERLGRIMAQLHDHAQGLNPPHSLSPKRWDRVFYYPDEPIVYNTEPFAKYFPSERIEMIDEVIARSESFLQDLYEHQEEPFWIHGDLHYWNVHVYGGVLTVIDFEDIMLGYPVQDIAVTLYYGDHRQDYPELRQAFQRGYSSKREWPVNTEYQLQTLWAARTVNFINYMAYINPDPVDYIERRCQDLYRYLEGNWK
jgi:Ser/Thr protein kinase RdoA (MazF antagonist)